MENSEFPAIPETAETVAGNGLLHRRALLGRDGDAAALLANLRKKAADLSGGALD